MKCKNCDKTFKHGLLYCGACLIKDDGYIDEWVNYCKKLNEMRTK